LPFRRHLAVARERRQHFVVADILRKRLEILGCPASLLAEPGEHVAERVRVAVGQARRREGVAEYFPDRRRATSAFPIEAGRGELPIRVEIDPRRRKERIVGTP
jgi:hypothetical protein